MSSEACVAEQLYDAVWRHNATALSDPTVVVAVAPYVLLAAGLAVAAAGHLLVRLAFVVVGFVLGAGAALQVAYGGLARGAVASWSCEVVVATCVGVGGVCAAISVTLLRTLTLLLAASTGGLLSATLLEACPVCSAPAWPGSPVLWGRPLVAYWLAVGVASIAGGVAGCYRRHHVVIAVTSVAGGLGASTGGQLLLEEGGTTPPDWASPTATLAVAAAGVSTQLWLRRRRGKGRRAVDA